jgi:hypothetical protein
VTRPSGCGAYRMTVYGGCTRRSFSDNAQLAGQIASGEVVRTFRLTDNAISMDFSLDRTVLATTGGVEYKVRLWDVESGNLLDSLPHNMEATACTML